MEGNRKLAAILAADVAGYSRLMGDDEAATVHTLTEYRQVFTEHSARHGGRVDDTAGDSVLAVFDSAVEELNAPWRSRRRWTDAIANWPSTGACNSASASTLEM